MKWKLKLSVSLLCILYSFVGQIWAQPPFYYDQLARKYMATEKYDSVIWASVISLELWPKGKKSRPNLQKSFSKLTSQSTLELDSITSDTKVFRGDYTVQDLRKAKYICERDTGITGSILQNLPSDLRAQIIQDLEGMGLPDYMKIREEVVKRTEPMTDSAAWLHYTKAQQLMTFPHLDSNRLATFELERGMSFRPFYEDSRSKYGLATEAGTKRIGILPFYSPEHIGAPAEPIAERIFDAFMNEGTLFIELVYPDVMRDFIYEQQLGPWAFQDPEPLKPLAQEFELHEIWWGEVLALDAGKVKQSQNVVETFVFVKDTIGREKKVTEKGRVIYEYITKDRKVNFSYLLTQRVAKTNMKASFQVVDLRGTDKTTNVEDRTVRIVFDHRVTQYKPRRYANRKYANAAQEAYYRIERDINQKYGTPIPSIQGRINLLNVRFAAQLTPILQERESLEELKTLVISRKDQLLTP
ncbi:MAG: hypothetical protein AAFP89_26480 [Bacteroidota bacterium]